MYQMRALKTLLFVNIESVLEISIVSGVHVLTVFGWRDTIFPFELFAKVGGRETYFGGDGRYGLLGVVVEQTERFLQTDIVDILRERESASVLSQQVVQGMAADVEAVADVLTLQTNVGIEPFGADGGVNGIEKTLPRPLPAREWSR